MADINIDDIYAELDSAFTEGKPSTKKERVAGLLDEAAAQKKLIADMKKIKDPTERNGKIVAQRDWIRANADGSYSVKIGRAAYPYKGKKGSFHAADLDAADKWVDRIVALLGHEDFQKQIREYEAPKKAKK